MDIIKLKGDAVLTGNATVEKFSRLPDEVIAKVPRLEGLAHHTSGIKTSFYTNSTTIQIIAKVGNVAEYTHMSLSGSSGFDVYVNGIFKNNVRPEYNNVEINGTIELGKTSDERKIDIYFPMYNSVDKFLFKLDKGALKRKPDKNRGKVLFYGSSITQGGCASHPGNSYTNIVGRMMNMDVINLGFSGNARGDIPIAEYIGNLDIDAFVYDYDHNAPDTEFLKATHEPFFKVLRNIKPELPIIMMSRPGFEKWFDIAKFNTQVVMTTYLNALNSGDDNVYFIDGKTLFGISHRDACTVDGTHPNDLGFLRMAETVACELKHILEEK